MPLDFNRTRPLLQGCQFRELFVEHLGWESCRRKLTLKVSDCDHPLTAVAEKRGFVVWLCESTDSKLPDRATRLKLDRTLSQTNFEHLIVFVPADKSCQSWLWVRRELGRPLRAITHDFSRNQPGDSLLQKLERLFVSLEEEEAGLSVTEISGRVRAAFNVERVTKKFYEEFKKQHAAFLAFIEGIGELADREWYASVMLNRLMFVYFIQRKGFLDGDGDYLRNRLNLCQREKGKDKFHSFYRYFLLRLFHDGLGGKQRPPELEKLLGRIPYLNGGMFDKHIMEERHSDKIQIPDKAFERIFDYFDQYQWHLDERPLRADNEINPDVLGYIFEKYINQKQMGAYYTKEDITDCIGKNTIIPFLFDAARKDCLIAFEGGGSRREEAHSKPGARESQSLVTSAATPTIWDLLRENPERYIYPAVRHGADKSLPAEIAAGVDDVSKRTNWNKPAPAEFALPTETWREVIARKKRRDEIKRKLAAGEVRDINDLITLNLDIRQFAQDVIEDCQGPDLLRAVWHAIENVTILDPTCGSGAFLFAALNILEPLYEACLDRMEAFVADAPREKQRAEKLSDFREVLNRVASHPSPKYFIYKSIILQNLFGVDIMEEAVEICKLRLFLKLAAQIEPDTKKENLGIEPLPDIDFNICAGNTLVGYATLAEVENSMFGRNYLPRIQKVDEQIRRFRKRQSQAGDLTEQREDKQQIRTLLAEIREKLDTSLFTDYGARELTAWKKSHQPFHWYVEFNSIIQNGGFDVIIGNPPYVVNTPEKVGYGVRESLFATYASKNLYAFVFERSLQLGGSNAEIGMIVQLTALSAEKMSSLQDLLLCRGLLATSAFPRRPESIFDGVEMPVTIMISRSSSPTLHTTRVNRFYTEERPSALSAMGFAQHDVRLHGHRIAKIGSLIDVSIYRKIESQKGVLGSLTSAASKHVLYYQEACRYWVKACVGLPFFRRNGERIAPPHGRTLHFRDAGSCAFAGCLMNSTLFYWFYSAFSDCEHINDALIRDFRIPSGSNPSDWIALESRLAESQKRYARRKTILTKQGHKIEYDGRDAPKSKLILDEIDTVLARHYGFTAEELDFILNYDIKYRLGRDTEGEAE